jgi:exonuclease VII small subunit
MPKKYEEPLLAKLDPLILVEIVRRLIRVGVPPTAVANAFDLEPGPIKTVARNIRRDTYGTAELSEAHSFLTWLAYEKLLGLMQTGSPEIQLKAAMQVQAKAMSISARQTPEEVSEARREFAELIDDIEISEETLEQAAQEYEDARAQVVPSDDLEE